MTPGFGTTSIITNAKPPCKVVANSVGSDIMSDSQSYPLIFRKSEETDTQPNASIAIGYSTKHGE
jgi:hypothetical protein